MLPCLLCSIKLSPYLLFHHLVSSSLPPSAMQLSCLPPISAAVYHRLRAHITPFFYARSTLIVVSAAPIVVFIVLISCYSCCRNHCSRCSCRCPHHWSCCRHCCHCPPGRCCYSHHVSVKSMPLDSKSTKVGPSSKKTRLSLEALCPALPDINFLHHGAQPLLPILRH